MKSAAGANGLAWVGLDKKIDVSNISAGLCLCVFGVILSFINSWTWMGFLDYFVGAKWFEAMTAIGTVAAASIAAWLGLRDDFRRKKEKEVREKAALLLLRMNFVSLAENANKMIQLHENPINIISSRSMGEHSWKNHYEAIVKGMKCIVDDATFLRDVRDLNGENLKRALCAIDSVRQVEGNIDYIRVFMDGNFYNDLYEDKNIKAEDKLRVRAIVSDALAQLGYIVDYSSYFIKNNDKLDFNDEQKIKPFNSGVVYADSPT